MEMNLTFTGKRRRIVRFLLMSLLSCMLILPAQAQDRVTVSGRLTDTGQNPLIGASVIERGTTNGVTTDVDGRYQISVAKNATLDFSFVGYKTQSVAVANRTQIDVTLEEDAMMIGEVVAIGYGSQRKEDLSMAGYDGQGGRGGAQPCRRPRNPAPGPHAGRDDPAIGRRPDAQGVVLHPRTRLERQ